MKDRSILTRLEEAGRPAPHVDLLGGERSDDAGARYTFLGEIARGGSGVVHHGRDNDLGREVALKVLRDESLADAELVRRFVEEAQIGAQLQHPGIVPVYELGLRDDRRPFFAMKLVKGMTLAERLAERRDPGEDRRELLAILREACRTVAYAHARSVIHRDLKPSNVMSGSYGEVQVVDWGFAKILRRGGIADERLAKKAARMSTIIATVRSETGVDPSVAGSVMGTPAYMPPEQALGRVEDLDARSDVFCLGAILCEILTGAPPFSSIQDALHCVLDDVHARLERCGADENLIDLCRRTLAPLPKDRPASAQVVADEIAAYLSKAEGRAHRTAVRAAHARADAQRQARGRRFTRAIAAAVLVAIVIVGGTLLWIRNEQAGRDRRQASLIAAAVREATRAREGGDFDAALVAAERARDLGGSVDELVAEVRGRAEARRAIRQCDECAAALAADFDELGMMSVNPEFSNKVLEAERHATLARHGVTVESLPDRFAGSSHARRLAANLDVWAYIHRFNPEVADPDPHRFITAARRLDPGNDEIRTALESGEGLGAFASPERAASLSPAHAMLVAYWLVREERFDEAVSVARASHRRHPGYFWSNFQLGSVFYYFVNEPGEALRYLDACKGLRPESREVAHLLALALFQRQEHSRAVQVLREALERYPDWAHGYAHLAQCLAWNGDEKGAAEAIRDGFSVGDDEMLYSARASLRYERGDVAGAASDLEERKKRTGSPAMPMLVVYYAELGRIADAELELASLPDARQVDPSTVAYIRSWFHRIKGEPVEAEQAAREATELNSRSFAAFRQLGESLEMQGRWREAEKAYRRIVRLWPRLHIGHQLMSEVQRRQGRIDDALASAKRVLDLSDGQQGWASLYNIHFHARFDYAEALRVAEKNLEIWSDDGNAWAMKAQVLLALSRWDEARDAARRAARFGDRMLSDTLAWLEQIGNADPRIAAAAWTGICRMLMRNGCSDAALGAARSAVSLDDSVKDAWGCIASTRFAKGEHTAALEAVDRVLEIDPAEGSAHDMRGSVLMALGRPEEAWHSFARAPALLVDLPDAYALQRASWGSWFTGQFRIGLAAARKLVEFRPGDRQSHYYLGVMLSEHKRHREAADALAEAVRLGFVQGDIWSRLGTQLVMAGEFRTARERLRGKNTPVLSRAERYVSLEPDLARIVSGERQPENAAEAIDFALLCEHRGEYAAARRLYRDAGEITPFWRYHAASCSAVLAGDSAQGRTWMRRFLDELARIPKPHRVRTLETLRLDPELASVRDGDDIPDDWRALWREIDELIKKEREPPKR